MLRSLFLFLICLAGTLVASDKPDEASMRKKAVELAHRYIILDGHVDVPYRLNEKWEEIGERTKEGDFDYPRAKEGGLDVPFMSIYIPASRENNGAKLLADTLINMVESFVTKWPEKFAIPASVDDVRTAFAAGKISLPMGMENGAPIEGDLKNVRYFYKRGIRYITLAHSKSNHISDSSYDPEHRWNGLSPFGKELVREMNKVGIMVDVSHISDSAFYQVMRVTNAPVIASHSSCRFFTPGFERNMSDEMIKLLAQKGGVIQINFGSTFIDDDIRNNYEKNKERIAEFQKAHDEHGLEEFLKTIGRFHADVSDVAKHIDHVVKLVGIDYVGLGSDFDGVGDSLPVGLKDVSQYPNLIYELLKRGYSDEDIQKICSGNVLRVWSRVEQIALEMSK